MNRRDLVKAAIAHRETRRVPYSLSLCQETWDLHFKDKVPFVNEDGLFDNDVYPAYPPWWGWHELGADWYGMDPPASPPKVAGTGSYEKFFDNLKAARDATGKYILVMIYGSHFEKAYFARGIENLLADLAGNTEFARSLLNRVIDKNMVMLENFLNRPEIDGVLLGSDWGSQNDLLMSMDTWNDLIRPGEQREYDLIKSYGKDVWIHSCGNIERLIPSLIEMGVDVLNPVQPEAMDIARLKRDFGARLTFWGGISTQKTLPYGTPDEVKLEARQVKRMMAAGGGYIFAPAQSIQEDVPRANIEALLEVAREPN